MKIVYVGLRNIMGIKELEFSPGKITIVDGKNAKGKTSVLKGIQAGIGGGHDATLLTEGQQKGEVVIVFDDGMRLEKEIKRGKSKLTLKDVEGKPIPRAASYLKEIVDDLGVNPIQILTASPKDRVKLLLDSIKMETPFEEIEHITGTTLDRTDTRHPMQIIDEQRASFYEERTDNNRFMKDKEVMISQMREGLPFKAEDRDFDGDLKQAANQLTTLEEEFKKEITALDEWKNNHLESFRSQKEQDMTDLHAKFDRECQDVVREYGKEVQKLNDSLHPKINELSTQIGELRSNKEEATRVAGSIKYVKDGNQEILSIIDEIETMTAVINELDSLKGRLLQNLPIDGMEIREGEIYLDGVPFDGVNKAKKVHFALSIAGMRDAELPIVCVDNLEALDEESFAIFQEQAAKTDMQFFVTRVSENPKLTINTDEE